MPNLASFRMNRKMSKFASDDGSPASPMMAQYRAIKKQHGDAILFYRMGDFYEMFFDDAIQASEALDIALTNRGKGHGREIPMCGVPVHAAEGYLHALIAKGFHVAVCEQTEDPVEARKRGSKAVVSRDVVRIMTPGTLTEEALLNARQHNYLASVAQVRGACALAWADVSSGDFNVIPCNLEFLASQLARVSPTEILVSENADEGFRNRFGEAAGVVTPFPPIHFESATAERRLLETFGVSTLQAFGEFTRPELSALGAIVSYLKITQKGNLPLLRPPARELATETMQIDAATRRNLELTRDLAGNRENSLIGSIDLTLSSAGARLLESRISAPSTNLSTIRERHEQIAFFLEENDRREQLRKELRKLPDMHRCVTRLSLDRGSPRDMAAVRNGLVQAKTILKLLSSPECPQEVEQCVDGLKGQDDLLDELKASVVDEPPAILRDGGVVKDGYDPRLDEERRLRDKGRSVIAEMQANYSVDTGISSLKVKFNNVLGYFIEVRSAYAERLMSPPHSERFIHRQSTASTARFTTRDLSEVESRILNAGQAALEIERAVFSRLRGLIAGALRELSAIAASLAEIDVAAALAELAARESWTCPEIDETGVLDIRGGRHPVVEAALRSSGGKPFVANDCHLAGPGKSPRIRLVTGPNMAGKSTYLRQNALIALLAQAGSYVPAESARVGMVTQLFSRVGAADELARGRSTFMVEMVETAAILNQAATGALVILDEIGRGTATYDGLSIAWATLEHLHELNGCRALFATHYHELTALTDRLERIANSTTSVREWESDVVFLYEVKEGAADRSYGVQVAKLAGMPRSVVERASEILNYLESDKGGNGGQVADMLDDLPLFAAAAVDVETADAGIGNAARERLEAINPDELSPRQALALIYELKELLD